MGAFLSHAAVDAPSDDATTKWWEQHPVLREYAIERAYPTGSGRLFRTYRVRHRQSDTVAVVKVAWLKHHLSNGDVTTAVDEDTAGSSSATTTTTTAASTTTVRKDEGGSGAGTGAGGGGNGGRDSSTTPPLAKKDSPAMLSALARDLAALQTAARDCAAVWPYQFWCQGVPPEHNNNNARFPVALLRPHIYATLRERANNSRPFWGAAEKTYAVVQLLQAVHTLHQAGLVHGHLTTANVGVTSVGRLVLLDGWPALKQTTLPANDPTAYLYLFQTTSYNATATASTPCTLAPERFVDHHSNSIFTQPDVTPAMDIFAVGCIIVEVSLGQALFATLGQLLAYRNGVDDSVITAALAKLPSSALRAAAKHMLQRDPTQRLTAAAYLDRLTATGQVPPTFEMLDALVADTNSSGSFNNKVDVLVTPDARLVQCVKMYPRMVQGAMGQALDDVSLDKWRRWTAATTSVDNVDEDTETPSTDTVVGGGADNTMDLSSLIAETQALLEALEMDPKRETIKPSPAFPTQPPKASTGTNNVPGESPSQLCQDSLIIYLQIILSTLRHVQRPTSKWVALQLVQDMGQWTNDEARLSRIIPVTVSLLHDSDALVRATALQVLTHTVAQVTTFAPSDAALFSQYLVKRVSHLPSDPALVVRIAFAHSLAVWAHVAQQFLDVAHAVRLYEASALGLAGAGGSRSGTATPRAPSAPLIEASSRSVSSQDTVFSDDVAQLLDSATTATGAKSAELPLAGRRTLLGSSYLADRESLYETVSRWVVHVATDQSADASLAQRALLQHMDQLCHFFGSTGVMNFLLPQIVTFLNDRKDWQLRAALFENFTPVGQAIGRAATDEFVLPCLEIGLIDSEEHVIESALGCLERLVELGLVSRASLVGSGEQAGQYLRTGRQGLLERYVVFLVHPSEGIRRTASSLFCQASQALGGPDILVYILPILKPLLIYQPRLQHLMNSVELLQCLEPPLSRTGFQKELDQFAVQPSGAWTTVGVIGTDRGNVSTKKGDATEDRPMLQIPSIKKYLRMLSMHNAQMSNIESTQHTLLRAKAAPGIEANLKLAQSVMFPRQDYCTSRTYLPGWYERIQKNAKKENSEVSAQSTITSIAALGAVYGISIMGPVEGTTESIIGAAAEDGVRQDPNKEHTMVFEDAKLVEAASKGHWSAESLLDPDVVDASLLVTKLKALGVPELPPKLGEQLVSQSKPPIKNTGRGASKDAAPSEWRPRINALVATSSTITGHKAPVVGLAVSVDSAFFVSGSHDGTCGIWETSQLDDCVGILDSSLVYSGHSDIRPARINDVAMVEGTHSVVSGDSNGSVHVWRVDMVQSSNSQSTSRVARAVGTSEVRHIDAKEGEILSVTHFTGLSSSVLLYATQKGTIHSWDLRCAHEPFVLCHSPGLGHLTTMALGNDRQWLVSGTNKGYVALWDVRFQNAVKLWRNKSGEKIHRVATSFVPPPQYWSGRFTNTEPRPFAFLGSGANECTMFDLVSGSCRECFRTVWTDSKVQNEGLPSLLDIKIKGRFGSKALVPSGPQFQSPVVSSYPAINCMVGSVGGQNQSFLMTGGSDRRIRFWDFATPSRCYSVAGEPSNSPRSSYERIDFEGPRRLMLCRQPPSRALRESGRIGNSANKGLKKPENHHTDAIMDIKIIDNCLVSCSRDCTLKVWR